MAPWLRTIEKLGTPLNYHTYTILSKLKRTVDTSDSPPPGDVGEWVDSMIVYFRELVASFFQWWRDTGRALVDHTWGQLRAWGGWKVIHQHVEVAVEWANTAFHSIIYFSKSHCYFILDLD